MAKTAAEKQAAYRERKAQNEMAEAVELNTTGESVPQADPVLTKLDKILVQDLSNQKREPIETPQVAHVPKNEPIAAHIDFSKCMRCGMVLPPTETPRLVQELCHDCVWRNSGK